MLELGVGNGSQARVWLDEFVRLDRERGTDYYRRLHYLMGDYSPHVLDLARAAVRDHAERVSGLVLEHLRELDGFFAEARRALRPGGRAVVSAMHPAMFLRGTQARFTDPASGERVQPGSVPHSVAAFVMAAVQAGFRLSNVAEHAPDAEFARRYPRAERYIGWPMLVVLSLLR